MCTLATLFDGESRRRVFSWAAVVAGSKGTGRLRSLGGSSICTHAISGGVQKPMVCTCKNSWFVCARTYGLYVQKPMVCVCKKLWFVCARTNGLYVQKQRVCKNLWFRCAKMRRGLPQGRWCANEKPGGPPSLHTQFNTLCLSRITFKFFIADHDRSCQGDSK